MTQIDAGKLADLLEHNANDCEDMERWATPELAPLLRRAAAALRACDHVLAQPQQQREDVQPVAGTVCTDQPIFDAIAAATSINKEPDGFPRIVMSAAKFIETFNNHRDRKLCTSLYAAPPPLPDSAGREK